jgi:hypothetical protein
MEVSISFTLLPHNPWERVPGIFIFQHMALLFIDIVTRN